MSKRAHRGLLHHTNSSPKAMSGLLFMLVVALVLHVGDARSDDSAAKGKKVFEMRGCTGCHTIGDGNRAGPDLKGVTQRRSADWLKSWLKDPNAKFAANDKIADKLADRFLGVHMPNLGLSDEEIKSLLSYFQSNDGKPAAATK